VTAADHRPANRRSAESRSVDTRALELLRRVSLLEIAARRNAASLGPGRYRTSIPGRGLDFHELRRYVPGEPARRIDWNVTARLGEPYVKVHLEERQRKVQIALDLSPSMDAGFARRTKLEVAVELAATLAVSAIDAGDRLGWVHFADRVHETARPQGGRTQLFRALRAMLRSAEAPPATAVSDPRAAIHAIESQPGGPFVVFLISDFIDHDLPDDLRYVRERHDVSLFHVYDPLEYGPAIDAVVAGRSPEGGRRGSVRPGELGPLEEMLAFLEREGARRGLDLASFSTAEPVGAALDRFFHRKRRRPLQG